MKKYYSLSLILMLIFIFCAGPGGGINESIPSPESYFGFKIGTDRKLANMEQIVEYFTEVGSLSGRIIVNEVGKTTEGNPFIMAIISSEDNIKNIEKLKDINAKLADPRKITEIEAEQLLKEAKAVIGINASIHATEVGPAQASTLLIYKLTSDNSAETKKILDNAILILTPMHNPDGFKMVTDWWEKYVGTEYEGSRLPYLYHKYTGHDNNRDWYMFTQKETQHTIKNLYGVWHPQIVVDMHQMGSGGARLFVPPFTEPYEPNIDPIITANVNMIGTFMANRLTAKGLTGVDAYRRFDAWTPGRAFQHYHGAVRILTEVASVGIAAPINIAPEALERSGRLTRSVFFPKPWPGGAWTLADVVKYNYEAAMAAIVNAASLREYWVYNFYQIGKNAIAEKTDPFAVVIPAEQKDTYTTKWMMDILQTGMVEIHKAESDFTANGRSFKAGSAVIYMNQPYYSFAKTLLEPQVYPELRQFPGGPLKRPYDLVANTLPLLMGVDVVWVKDKFEVNTTLMTEPEVPAPAIAEGNGTNGFILSINSNATYIVLNRLLNDGITAYMTTASFIDSGTEYPAGTVIINAEGENIEKLKTAARELNVDLSERSSSSSLSVLKLNPVKLGLYQSHSGNMNEGWTRWVMEKFEFGMNSLKNDQIITGNLNDSYNSILLSNFNKSSIMEGRRDSKTPPEYKGGIGADGLRNMVAFVRNGGTLITYGSSNDFAIETFRLNIRNVTGDAPRGEVYIPGSILKTTNETSSPIAFGLPQNGNLFYRIGSFFQVNQGRIVSRYPRTSDLLLSGWLEGGSHLAGKANVVEAPVGRGRVVLIGFDPIYRAQAQTTFKYIFNSMFYGAAERTSIPEGN